MVNPEQKLSDHVKSRGLKSSSQRNVVLEVMTRVNKHCTIEEIYDFCRKQNQEIGIATVYRTVRLLCDAGIARELRVSHDISRYEVVTDEKHHDHIVCVSCGRFVEIHSESIEKEQDRIAREQGFILTDHSHVLYGECSVCRAKVKGSRK